MSEHLTDRQIRQFRNRDMEPDALRMLDAHIGECPVCRQRLWEEPERNAAMRSLQILFSSQPAHLSYEQLEKWVDGDLQGSERTVVEAHLRDCTRCRKDAEDLQAARLLLIKALPAVQEPAPVTPQRDRRPLFRQPVRAWTLSLAGISVVAVLVWLVFPRLLIPRPMSGTIGPGTFIRQQALLIAIMKERDQALDEVSRVQQESRRRQEENDRLTRQALARERENRKLYADNTALKTKWQQSQQDAKRAKGLISLNVNQQQRVASAYNNSRFSDLQIMQMVPGAHPHLLLRGDFTPLQPDGTVVVSAQPILRWTSVGPRDDPAHTHYEVVVHDRRNVIVRRGETHPDVTSWMVDPPLTRGQVYTWEVRAIPPSGMPQTPESDPKLPFKVMGQTEAVRLLEAQIKLAILYTQKGLYDEAEGLMEGVIQADALSDVGLRAQRLRDDLRAQRHRPK